MKKVSCQSLTSRLIKVIGNFLDDYQRFRKNAAKVFVNSVVPGKSGASKVLNGLIDQAIDLQTSLLKAHGVIAGQGRGKIGPRYQIIPTKKVTGNLKVERTYIFTPSPFDKVVITVKKTGGKAGIDMAACVKYANGSHFNEKRKSIEKGKDSKGDSVKFVFTDMAKKLVTLHLVQSGFPSNFCDYRVSAEGTFNQKELESIEKSNGVGAVRA